MFEAAPIVADSKAALYAELALQARALLEGEPDRIANAANLSALAYPVSYTHLTLPTILLV